MAHTFTQLIRSTGPVLLYKPWNRTVPSAARTMGGLSFCDFSSPSFSLLFSSLILSSSSSLLFSFCQRFFSFSSFFLSFYFTRSIPSFVLTCSRLCTEHLLGLVFFSSNLARVNADGRFELFQFSERWDSEQEQSGGISGSNIREIRSLSGICSDIIRACCLTNYRCDFLSFNYGGMERNLRQGKCMNWQSF